MKSKIIVAMPTKGNIYELLGSKKLNPNLVVVAILIVLLTIILVYSGRHSRITLTKAVLIETNIPSSGRSGASGADTSADAGADSPADHPADRADSPADAGADGGADHAGNARTDHPGNAGANHPADTSTVRRKN